MIERKIPKDFFPRWLGRIVTFIIVVVGWTLFRFEDFNTLWVVLKGMVGITPAGLFDLGTQTSFLENVFLLIVSFVACMPLGKFIQEKLTAKAEGEGALAACARIVVGVSDALIPAVLLVIAVIALAGAGFTPFIYANF